MNQQFEKKIIISVIFTLSIILSFMMGSRYNSLKTNDLSLKTDSTIITDKDFAPFWKVWNLLDEKYVTAASSTSKDKVYGAIKGLVASEGDPYTVFFPPEEAKMFESDIAGSFEGVGMEVGIKDGVLTVVSPMKGSPAEKGGMRTGDKILKIDSQMTNDISVDKAVKLIRGPKGTKVKMLVIPVGSKDTVERVLVRDTISIPTIETEVKGTDTIGDVFIIRLFSFSATSPDLFKEALRKFVKSGSHKLILDLRGNPGGYLEAAWDIASWFLPAGKVIVSEDFGKKAPPRVYRSKGYNIFDDKLKMVILVDGGSASASEILAGALHEHGVAKLVGTKTFGKGSVQELVKITPDTSLKVTIARWLTPNGLNISKNGLEPDVKVELTEKDIKDKKDLQQEKAVEILKALP